MTDEQIAVELEHHRNEIASLKHRVSGLEGIQEAVHSLAASVNELAINMKYMMEEQRKQGARLEKLESEPAARTRYWVRYIIGAVIGAVISAAIGVAIGMCGTVIF